jgi:hypothetical protein
MSKGHSLSQKARFHGNAEAQELAGLAVATGALLRAERALFSPTLGHLLREPGRAAAATLYTLFGQRLQPWLAKSARLQHNAVWCDVPYTFCSGPAHLLASGGSNIWHGRSHGHGNLALMCWAGWLRYSQDADAA